MNSNKEVEHDDLVLEHQPFLPSPDDDGQVEAAYDRHSNPRSSQTLSRWNVAILLLLVVASAFCLAGLALSFPPISHQDPETQDSPASAAAAAAADSDEAAHTLHYHEEVPSAPQLRSMDEYVLDRSWDVNASPATREYHWTVTDAELNPDGIYRPMMLINNQFPGPLVECNDGDTIVVHLDNQAINATALHFHGLFQNGTNAMDGTVGVTQCPVAPGTSFTYRFVVRGQSGTYWYHSHHSAQASDGLLGPVVIHSKDEPALQELDYDTDRVIMVQDHYHNTTSELLMSYLGPVTENIEPVPDNALINGHGVRECDDFPGWRCDASNTSTPVFDLPAGQRHRLRIINVGAFAEFQMQIDEHPFHIIEVDGTDVHPEPFHRLNILPAQRYSIIVHTNSTTANAFWLRARMVSRCFKVVNDRLEPEIRAIIRYTTPDAGAHVSEPTSKDWPEAIEVVCKDLNTSILHPVQRVPLPPATDYINLRASFHIGAWRLSRGFFNDSTLHVNASHPSLHRFLDAHTSPTSSADDNAPLHINDAAFAPDQELVLQTTGIRTVDIAINNFDDGAHPFHLHGHKFFVLIPSTTGYPPSAGELPTYLATHGLENPNPLRRDTVTVEGYGWAVIRVVLDNPGLWPLHCHNAWHAEAGMVMQLLVRSEVVRQWEVDAQQREMCAREGVTTGMRPDDSIWFGRFD